MKKICSWLLVLAMLVTWLPAGALAAGIETGETGRIRPEVQGERSLSELGLRDRAAQTLEQPQLAEDQIVDIIVLLDDSRLTATPSAGVRQALLDTGLEMAVNKGLGGLHLAELTRAVGISKPYFYTFFDSLEDFSLQMMEEQRCRLLRLLEQELARPEGTWEEHVESFFRTILRHRENGILVMTQGEEADLHSRLTPERFQDFRPGQRDFFLRLMALLDIRQEDCAPEVLANLVFSCLLIYNSAPESMPFLFPSHLEETAALHVKFLVNYLGSLRNAKKDR